MCGVVRCTNNTAVDGHILCDVTRRRQIGMPKSVNERLFQPFSPRRAGGVPRVIRDFQPGASCPGEKKRQRARSATTAIYIDEEGRGR